MADSSFIILGYGKFGNLAHQRLAQAFKQARFTIVDSAQSKLQGMISESDQFIHQDAAEYLARLLDCSWKNPIIVPMAPAHIAAEAFLKAKTNIRRARLEIIDDTPPPNWLQIDDYTGCCSWATFICPDNCPEGPLCQVTKRPRKEPMHDLLRKTEFFGRPITVIRSEQILPGVGGYTMKALRKALYEIPSGKFALATSCKCHGIVTGMENPFF